MMKILLGYSYYKSTPDVKKSVEEWLDRLRAKGIDVDPFCLTLDPPNAPIVWPELDTRWKNGDRALLALCRQLAEKTKKYDVFVNWNGINLHPEFVRHLPTFNIFGCFDDPESSELLSKPVATSYDLCMVGNIAELKTYKSWGVKHAYFWPNGFRGDDYDPTLTEKKIRTKKRNIDVSFLGERVNKWRQNRLDEFAKHFPQGKYYGRGWDSGFLPEKDRIPLLQNSKIGINIHNSTGPINIRTFHLPANGVMQICDNKKYLGKIYKLGHEAIGFDTIKEAIDACEYYLHHDKERIDIAVAGWKKAIKDYNEYAVFKVMVDKARKHYRNKKDSINATVYIDEYKSKTKLRNQLYINVKAARKKIGGLISRS